MYGIWRGSKGSSDRKGEEKPKKIFLIFMALLGSVMSKEPQMPISF